MEAKPLVSIIVPVYNAKNHIARCIESIRAQTYQNIEIILVNDGSSDNVSLPVCEMYARADSRIIVVDKDNAGVSDTRNRGMELSAGKYLQFVDSDDYLAPDYTENLVATAEAAGADMVIAHYNMVIPRTMLPLKLASAVERKRGAKAEKERPEPEIRTNGFLPAGVMDKNTFALHLMDEPASFYYGVMWNKLYRRDIIIQNDIRCWSELGWKEGFMGLELKGTRELYWSEDFLFNLNYIRYAETFASTDKAGYYYVQNPDSTIHSKMTAPSAISLRVMLFGYYCDLYKSLGLYEENKLQICKYLVGFSESTQPTSPLKKSIEEGMDAVREALRSAEAERDGAPQQPGDAGR